MKNKWIFLLMMAAATVGCAQKGSPVDLIPSANRVSAAEIKAQFLNASNSLALSQTKGKVLIVDFWATWCGPCRMEIPSLVQLYNNYHEKGLELWGLSVEGGDGKPKEYFDKFISDFQIQYPTGLAATETLKAYGINPIPTTFFIDKRGKIALSFVGVHPEEDFVAAVEKLLAE